MFDIDSEETFFQVAEKVREMVVMNQNEDAFIFGVSIDNKEQDLLALQDNEIFNIAFHGTSTQPRNYYRPLSEIEIENLHYILNTLADKSLASIFTNKGPLEAAGDNIINIHPLRFLNYVFSNETLKTDFHKIRNKKLIWKNFVSGIKNSLDEEASVYNLREEYVEDFAHSLQINKALISPSIQARNWDEFIEILIVQIPRKGNPRRYDSWRGFRYMNY